MKRNLYMILLLTISLASCVFTPTPNIVLPAKECTPKIEYKVQQCPIPPNIRSIPTIINIKYNDKVLVVDEGGEQLLRDYAEIRKWKKQYYQ